MERFKKIEKNKFMIRDKKILLIFITMIFAFKFIYTGNCFSQNISTSFINDTSSTYALVVGISAYQNIKPLKYADDDAYLFSQFLINENITAEKGDQLENLRLILEFSPVVIRVL